MNDLKNHIQLLIEHQNAIHTCLMRANDVNCMRRRTIQITYHFDCQSNVEMEKSIVQFRMSIKSMILPKQSERKTLKTNDESLGPEER